MRRDPRPRLPWKEDEWRVHPVHAALAAILLGGLTVASVKAANDPARLEAQARAQIEDAARRAQSHGEPTDAEKIARGAHHL